MTEEQYIDAVFSVALESLVSNAGVADEVRKLAENSETAASQIAVLLTEIKDGTHEAVASMDDGTRTVAEGVTALAGTVEAVQRIVEESDRIAQMATDMQEIV